MNYVFEYVIWIIREDIEVLETGYIGFEDEDSVHGEARCFRRIHEVLKLHLRNFPDGAFYGQEFDGIWMENPNPNLADKYFDEQKWEEFHYVWKENCNMDGS